MKFDIGLVIVVYIGLVYILVNWTCNCSLYNTLVLLDLYFGARYVLASCAPWRAFPAFCLRFHFLSLRRHRAWSRSAAPGGGSGEGDDRARDRLID